MLNTGIMVHWHVRNDNAISCFFFFFAQANFLHYFSPLLFFSHSLFISSSSVGIFDVSHMLQTQIDGKDRVDFIESLVVTDIAGTTSYK